MKLSSSLLAICGVYADYACCPYDDFGIPEAGCVADLTERTAWANSADEQDGLVNNACKAWEANTDGTFDGNLQSASPNANEDWGGCGFQRHFPWVFPVGDGSVLGVDTANYVNHLLNTDNSGLAAGSFNWMDDNGMLGTHNAANRHEGPYGRVSLDGVCKLFVPVDMDSIQYVTIAGVHVRGGGADNLFSGHGGVGSTGCGAEGCAVFQSRIADTTAAGVATKSMDGTSFCFTVANDAEGFENTNGINNGNVAGDGNDGALSGALNGDPWQSKAMWPGYDTALSTTPGNSELGNNFDVVVHLKSDYCKSHWTEVDMQSAGEFGQGAFDYPFPASWQGADVDHAHHDMYDKRIPGGSNGSGITGAGNLAQGTGSVNTFAPTGTNLWPNVGAWAGYYSFVSCDFDNTPAGFATNSIYNLSSGDEERILVMSNMNMDFRHDSARDSTVTIRGNLRQVGTTVKHCGAGSLFDDMPVAGASERCSWNWNMNTANDESFWTDVSTWDSNTHELGNNDFTITTTLSDLDFDFDIHLGGTQEMAVGGAGGNSFSGGVANGWSNEFLNTGAAVVTMDCNDQTGCACAVAALSTNNHFNCNLPCVAASATAADGNTGTGTHPMDQIPDCFFGEEIHFELVVASTEAGADYVSAFFSKAFQSTGSNNT